jgi:hypothetical protein
LKGVRIVASLEESLTYVVAEEGIKPILVGTSARIWPKAYISYEELRRSIEGGREPVYIIFGTGWGLAPEVIDRADYMLPPIWGPGEYNYLSVRAAAAIILDRLRGRREQEG